MGRPQYHSATVNQPHFALMKIYATKLCPNARFLGKNDHAKTISEKSILCIDVNMTSIHFSAPTATQTFIQMEPAACDNFPCKFGYQIHATLSMLPYGYTHFYDLEQPCLTYLPLSATFEAGDGDLTPRYVTGRFRQTLLPRMKPHGTM